MPRHQTPGDKAERDLRYEGLRPHAGALMTPANLAVAVLDDHEHRRVLALHRPVQRLNAHAVLGGAESQRPRVADRPRREILGELKAVQRERVGGWGGNNQRLQGCSNPCSITSAVTFQHHLVFKEE